jgi:hypothetical protein
MAGAPWENAGKQTEYSGGTDQEYEWPHSSWDSRHFSLGPAALKTPYPINKLFAIVLSKRGNQERGL